MKRRAGSVGYKRAQATRVFSKAVVRLRSGKHALNGWPWCPVRMSVTGGGSKYANHRFRRTRAIGEVIVRAYERDPILPGFQCSLGPLALLIFSQNSGELMVSKKGGRSQPPLYIG